MGARAGAVAIAALALLGSVAAQGSIATRKAPEAPDADAMAARVLRAHAAGDADDLRAVLATPRLDAFALVDSLLGRAVEAPQDEAPLAAARAFAALARDRAAWAQVGALVERSVGIDREVRALEVARRRSLAELLTARKEGRWADILAAVPESAAAPDAPTLAGLRLSMLRAEALAKSGCHAEALAAHRSHADAAERIGWLTAAAEAAVAAGNSAFKVDGADAAIAEYERAVTLNTRAGESEKTALCLASLAALHQQRGDIERALEFIERARRVHLANNDPVRAAKSLEEQGTIEGFRGRHELSLELYQRAHAELVAAGDAGEAAAMLVSIATACQRLGRPDAALAWLARARAELDALGKSELVATAWRWTAQCEAEAGRVAAACDACREAQRRLASLGNRAGAASCLSQLGNLHTRLGEHAAARACHEQALVEWRNLGDHDGETTALGNLGLACSVLGDYARAFELLEAALARNEATGNASGIDANLSALAIVHAGLGQPERALELHRRALQLSEASSDLHGIAASLNNVGLALADLRRFDEALEHYRRGLAITERTGNRLGTAALVGNIGSCLRDMGRFDEALEQHERALALQLELGNRAGAAAARDNIGLIHCQAGRHREALAAFETALAAEEDLGHRVDIAITWANIAEVRQRLGEHADALRAACRYQDLRLAEARGLGEIAAAGTRRLATRAAECALVSARGLLAEDHADAGPVLASAFHCVESGRALLLAEQVQNRSALLAASAPAELMTAEAAARSAVQAARARLARTTADAAEHAAARTDLDAAYRALEDVVARLQRAARRSTDVVFPQPVTLAALQAALPTDATFVAYLLGSKRAFAFAITRAAADIVDLGTSADLDRQGQAWFRLLQHPESDEATQAAGLYDLLVRPLEPYLGGRPRLLLAPDGVLSFLPFAALLRVDGERRERLVERLEVAYVPSATVFLAQAAASPTPGQDLVALGDPIYPGEDADEASEPATRGERELSLRGLRALPRLPGSGDEVRALADLFGEARSTVLTRAHANRDDLTQALGGRRRRALHIACHGHLDDARPRLSGLVLAGGEMLTLDDVARLDCEAELVVLSACDSGRGQLVSGEGVLGLVRAFMAAGAPRVVVANWRIGDQGTRELIVDFYRALLRDGLAPAAALRAIQRARLREGGAAAHPSQWAAFVVWGG